MITIKTKTKKLSIVVILLLSTITIFLYHANSDIENILKKNEKLLLLIIEELAFLNKLKLNNYNSQDLDNIRKNLIYFDLITQQSIDDDNIKEHSNKLEEYLVVQKNEHKFFKDTDVNFYIKVYDYIIQSNEISTFVYFREHYLDNNNFYKISIKPLVLAKYFFIVLIKLVISFGLIYWIYFASSKLIDSINIKKQNKEKIILDRLLVHEKLTSLFFLQEEDFNNNISEVLQNCIQYFQLELNNRQLKISIENKITNIKLKISSRIAYTIVLSTLNNIISILPKQSLITIHTYLYNDNLSIDFVNNGFNFSQEEFLRYSQFSSPKIELWLINIKTLINLFTEFNISYTYEVKNELNKFKINIPIYKVLTRGNSFCQIYKFKKTLEKEYEYETE